MTSLVPLTFGLPTRPSDVVGEIAKVKAVTDLLTGHEQQLRAGLEESIRALADAAGGQFTLRADTGQAYLAGGNLKVSLADPYTFGVWAEDAGFCEVAYVEEVDVDGLHQALAESDDLRKLLDEAGLLRQVPRVPADTCDRLAADGRLGDDGQVQVRRVDTDTGEVSWSDVPGVSGRVSRETLTVRPDAAYKERLADELRVTLGVSHP